MPSPLTRLLLFVSSYFPLALIFFVLLFNRHLWLAYGILALGLVGLIGMFVFLRMAQRIGPFNVKAVGIQRRDAEAMSYIVSYVIPFLSLPFGDWEQGFALFIFFVVLGILYVNSNMIHINPMLNLAGYHLYEITLDDGGIHSLITCGPIARGETLSVVKVGEDILLEKNK